MDIFISKLNKNSDSPSILSISDTLNYFQIIHHVLKINKNQITDLPNNFIALIKESRFSDESTLHFFYKEENLYVKECYVDEALVIKRIKFDSRGRTGRNDHKTSHITVIVAEK